MTRQQIMLSHGEGSLPAATQVKVLSPEIIHIAKGQEFHFSEASIGTVAKGETASGVPGAKSAADRQTVYIGTWESRSAPGRSRQGAEKATRRYGASEVGLTHTRGVAGAMPGGAESSLEGVSGLTLRGNIRHAIH